MFKKNKNMKKLFLNFAIVMLLPVMAGQVSGQQQSMKKNVNSKKEKAGTLPDNTLSRKEKKEGWKLLFNGNTADEWMNPRTKKFPESGWEIKDGVLLVNPATKTPGRRRRHCQCKNLQKFRSDCRLQVHTRGQQRN
jgi:hypothetical protein